MSTSKKPKSNNIVIIGSGLAGYTLVRELRRNDPAIPITVITADDGDYYSKPQLSSAFTHQKSAEQLVLFTAEKFSKQFNITIQSYTRVIAIDVDNKICKTTQGDISYDQLILACGANPKKYTEAENVYHVNNLSDYKRFRQAIAHEKQITIIGSGLVGCEFANDLVNGDYEVTVTSRDKYPLARLIPEEAGRQLQTALANKGVTWHFEKSTPDHNPAIILSAIGLQPETLLAQQVGIAVNHAIVVNDFLQTNKADIYALGDCAEVAGAYYPYVASLSLGARVLAKTLLGEATAVVYPAMPIYVKTPAYPVVVLMPKGGEIAESQLEQTQDSVTSLCYNHSKLNGFILAGTAVTKAQDLLKLVNL